MEKTEKNGCVISKKKDNNHHSYCLFSQVFILFILLSDLVPGFLITPGCFGTIDWLLSIAHLTQRFAKGMLIFAHPFPRFAHLLSPIVRLK